MSMKNVSLPAEMSIQERVARCASGVCEGISERKTIKM